MMAHVEFDQTVRKCPVKDHRRWPCHFTQGHTGDHAFTDADEMRILRERLAEAEPKVELLGRIAERLETLRTDAEFGDLTGNHPVFLQGDAEYHDVRKTADALSEVYGWLDELRETGPLDPAPWVNYYDRDDRAETNDLPSNLRTWMPRDGYEKDPKRYPRGQRA